MRVYGYPRSGNHFLMKALWLTFFGKDNLIDYRTLFGAHFGDAVGSPPNPVADSLAIVREPWAVMRSIWRMREWFGLTRHARFEDFLDHFYEDSFQPFDLQGVPLRANLLNGVEGIWGGDVLFSRIAALPLQHHRWYEKRLAASVRLVVSYDELISVPGIVLARIAEKFKLPYSGPVLPQEKVGYGV